MKTNDYKPLLVEHLSDVYCIEKESEKIIPKLQQAAIDTNLEETLEAQLTTSKSNIEKLVKASELIKIKVTQSNCESVKTVVSSAERYLNTGPVNDAGILSHLERINNYKSAIYNNAVRFAKELDQPKLYKELQNLANHTYNIIDRFGRLNSDQSDERAINNL